MRPRSAPTIQPKDFGGDCPAASAAMARARSRTSAGGRSAASAMASFTRRSPRSTRAGGKPPAMNALRRSTSFSAPARAPERDWLLSLGCFMECRFRTGPVLFSAPARISHRCRFRTGAESAPVSGRRSICLSDSSFTWKTMRCRPGCPIGIRVIRPACSRSRRQSNSVRRAMPHRRCRVSKDGKHCPPSLAWSARDSRTSFRPCGRSMSQTRLISLMLKTADSMNRGPGRRPGRSLPGPRRRRGRTFRCGRRCRRAAAARAARAWPRAVRRR